MITSLGSRAKNHLLPIIIMALAFTTQQAAAYSIYFETDQEKPLYSIFTEIGLDFAAYDYHEESATSSKGGLLGLYAAMGFQPTDCFLLQAYASIAGGYLDYEGYSTDDRPLSYDVPTFLANARISAGFPKTFNSVTIMPFAGVGVRYLDEDYKHNHWDGYRRETTQLYLPLGLSLSVASGPWSYGLRAEYDLFLTGLSRNRDVPLGGGHSKTVSLRQDTGFGVQGSLFLQRDITEFLAFTLEPFVSYWDINDSDVEETCMLEHSHDFQRKSNQTWFYGLRAGLAW